MVIQIAKFGELLISRPAGREAYLAAKAYILPHKKERIELDFTGVKVVTPSWLDEFLTPMQNEFGSSQVTIIPMPKDNPTLSASLATIAHPHQGP